MNAPDPLLSVYLDHFCRYPRMRAQDLFKLAYQQVFGGGHLIHDETESFDRLTAEVRAASAIRPSDMATVVSTRLDDRFEPIGNDLFRLHLSGIETTGIDLSTVNQIFARTAEAVTGTADQFFQTLQAIHDWIVQGALPFPLDAFDRMVSDYDFDTYPPVRHSPEFRAAYQPSYRIVSARFRDYFPVFCRIDDLMKTRQYLWVAIDGYCGAGKSTLAQHLQRIYDCPVIPMDHFFLPPDLRTEARLAEVGGNIDYERFSVEVLDGLTSGRTFTYRAYDCSIKSMAQEITVDPSGLVVIEGSYSLHPRFADAYGLKVFLDINPDEQLRRIRLRSPALFDRFQNEWIPMENRYFNSMQVAQKSDLVLKPL